MKRVIIFFSASHQTPLMEGLCKHLRENGVFVDLFDVQKRVLYPNAPSLRSKVFNMVVKIRISSLRKYLYCLLAKHYDIIEFQGLFWNRSLFMAKYLKSKGKRIKVQLWGSDFYRVEDYSSDWRTPIYDFVDKIQVATEQFKDNFLKVFPKNASKVSVVPFGCEQFETLKGIIEGSVKKDLTFLDHKADGKIIVACGYNGRITQQHFRIIDVIDRLPIDVKKRIFLIFPMTYLLGYEYYEYIIHLLNKINVDYQILQDRLSDIQMLSLRTISDVVINIQTTDVFAGSLQEHLMGGAVLIVGDWLPYKVYDDSGVFYIKSSIDNLYNHVYDVLVNLEDYKYQVSSNKDKVYKLSSWGSVICKWLPYYKS